MVAGGNLALAWIAEALDYRPAANRIGLAGPIEGTAFDLRRVQLAFTLGALKVVYRQSGGPPARSPPSISLEEELGMVVLITSAQVKPNAGGAFAQQFQQQLLSLIQAQPGFKDEMLLVVHGGPEIFFITFWESHANEESYERNVWPEFMKMLVNILERPVHRRFQLAHSTLHPEGSAAFPVQSPITSEPTGPGA